MQFPRVYPRMGRPKGLCPLTPAGRCPAPAKGLRPSRHPFRDSVGRTLMQFPRVYPRNGQAKPHETPRVAAPKESRGRSESSLEASVKTTMLMKSTMPKAWVHPLTDEQKSPYRCLPAPKSNSPAHPAQTRAPSAHDSPRTAQTPPHPSPSSPSAAPPDR